MIPAERSHLHVTAISHPGMSGKNNEDRYAVSAFRLEGEKPLPAVFAVLCDGVGGHRGGEVAAEAAVEMISLVVARSDASRPQVTLCEAIQTASQKILAMAEADVNLSGMASTCACAWVVDDRLYIAYVGDSRIYLIRDGSIRQLSNDHTWIQEALDAGILTPEQARGHPNAHVIRRHLGSQQLVEPDTRLRLAPGESNEQMLANQGLQLQAGDRVMLCSDGLSDLVAANEIQATLDKYEQTEAVNELTAMANRRGGHDNITIAVLQVPFAAPASTLAETIPMQTPAALPPQPARRKRSYVWAACLGVALLVVILLAFLAGVTMFVARRSLNATPTPPATETASPIRTLLAGSPTPAAPDGQASPSAASAGATTTPLSGATGGPPPATLTPWPTIAASPAP